jgi:site-specific recombinase XerD
VSDDLDPLSPDTALELYLDHRSGEISDQTLQTHRYRLGSFVEWCEANDCHNLNDLTGRDLHAYRVGRREEGDLKPVTLQGQRSTLRVFLEFCASIDAVPEDLRSRMLLPTVSGEEQTSLRTLDHEHAEAILEFLETYHASREHAVFALLWSTGMRMGSLQGIDLEDFDPETPHVELGHRPETGTTLKNEKRGERFVTLPSGMASLPEDSVDNVRQDVEDEYGRRPLVTTNRVVPRRGRFDTGSTA